MTDEPIIGLDLGGSKIAGAIVVNGKILEKRIVPTPQTGASSVIAAMLELGHELMKFAPSVKAIGVGSPGSVDAKSGVVRIALNIPGFEDIPLRQVLSAGFAKAVALENDAKAAALAEHLYGAARFADSSVFLTISTGIGGAIIQNNRIWRGFHGIAGEIGHIKIRHHGTVAGSSLLEALEGVASGTAIAHQASLVLGRSINAKAVFGLARAGNSGMLQIIDQAANCIGQVLCDLQLIVDPEVFVLGGGVSEAGGFFLNRIQTAANEHALEFAPVNIRQADLGTDAGVIGAACVAAQQIADSQTLELV
jgi:glucokinase